MEIGQFTYLSPYIDQGTGVAQVDQWVNAPLAFRSLDEPYTVYGLVAQKIERDPDHPTIVSTVRGVGYRAGAPTE